MSRAEIYEKSRYLDALADAMQTLEERLEWSMDTDENGNRVPPSKDDEWRYAKYKVFTDLIKQAEKLA